MERTRPAVLQVMDRWPRQLRILRPIIPFRVAWRRELRSFSFVNLVTAAFTYRHTKDPTQPRPYSFTQAVAGLERAHVAGARVHSNSYASINGGNYVANSGVIDRFAFLRPDSLLLYSSGNEEGDPHGNGVYDMVSLGTQNVTKNTSASVLAKMSQTRMNRPHLSKATAQGMVTPRSMVSPATHKVTSDVG
jgi:hypothetical protein